MTAHVNVLNVLIIKMTKKGIVKLALLCLIAQASFMPTKNRNYLHKHRQNRNNIGYQTVMSIKITDHLGNEFDSVRALAKFYGLDERTLAHRLQKMPIEQALTKTVQRKMHVTDHLGNEFDSINAMAKYHDVSYFRLTKRINRGMSPADALQDILSKNELTDNLGNRFDSIAAMAKYYNVSYSALAHRIGRGMEPSDAIKDILSEYKITDHLGNKFPSKQAMANHYNISVQTLNNRLKHMSLKDALTSKIQGVYEDYARNKFKSRHNIALYYNMSVSVLKDRLARMSLTDAIRTITIDKSYGDGLTILKKIDDDFYEVNFNNEIMIWHIESIFDHYRKTCLPNEGKDLLLSAGE